MMVVKTFELFRKTNEPSANQLSHGDNCATYVVDLAFALQCDSQLGAWVLHGL